MIEAVLHYSGKAIPLATLQSAAVTYPFVLKQPLGYVASNSSTLEVRAEGVSNQLIVLAARFPQERTERLIDHSPTLSLKYH